MASSTFVLKNPSGIDPTLVYLIFRYNTVKLKYSTGLKIKPKFWNPKREKQRAKEVKDFTEHAEFNTLLDNLEKIAHNEYRRLLNDKIPPTPDLIKIALDDFRQKGNKRGKDLISFGEYIKDNTDRKPATKKQLGQCIRLLKEFKQETNKSLHLDSIDLDFYDEFVDFLIKKDYGKNTIGTLIKNIKVFMNEAVDRNITTNLQFKNRRFKTVEENSETIYLSLAEIKTIYELDFTKKPYLDRVRDLFIIACYTGLRFSDLVELKKDNISKDGSTVKVRTIKTGELVIIPLHTYVKNILEKYAGMPPQLISNQKMNEYLKEIGEEAEIDEPIVISGTKGGVLKTETFKKWQLITTHTARRSFATNAYLQNVPVISIMKITGHRTEKSFMKYIKISQEDNANKLINHPFFK